MLWTAGYIASLTDPGSFARGVRYAEAGHVDRLRQLSDGTVTAQVSGTDLYVVRLGSETFSCTCPMGDDGVFCKHCVAVALTVSETSTQSPADPVGEWLGSLSRDALLDLIWDAVRLSDEFATELSLQAARSSGDLVGLRDEIDGQLRTRRGLEWRENDAFARLASPVVDAVCQLVDDGRAAEAIPLLRRAFGHLIKVIGRSDDSSGMIGDLIRQLLGYHAEACRQAPPPYKGLVTWLVKTGVDGDWFDIDVDQYADALGAAGIAAYRKEVERRLEADPDSLQLRRPRERLAVLDKDKAAVIELLGGSLEHANQYLRVVVAFEEMDLPDDALDFALRGIDSCTDWGTRNLVNAAAGLYELREDRHAVLALRRSDLARLPDHLGFNLLRSAAEALECWPAERAAALDQVTPRPQELVLCLLDDDPDAAWAAATRAPDQIVTELWLRLADLRAKTHPAEVLPVYQSAIAKVLVTADRRNYESAVKILRGLRTASVAAGEGIAFDGFVAELREQHRRRPTFITMLDRIPSAATSE